MSGTNYFGAGIGDFYYHKQSLAEAVIFIDEKGNKKLKRFIIGKCDEHCEKIKELLK